MDVDAARKRAKEVEQAIGRGDDPGPAGGLADRRQGPAGDRRAQRTTWGSLLFKDNVPAEDEFNVANVRRAGGVILGKTNTPEFGAGANTTNRVYGPTGNPFDPTKTCGGSSGGSAVALALGQVRARHRLRPRRQPAHAGLVLRRGRLSPLARRGAATSIAPPA